MHQLKFLHIHLNLVKNHCHRPLEAVNKCLAQFCLNMWFVGLFMWGAAHLCQASKNKKIKKWNVFIII